MIVESMKQPFLFADFEILNASADSPATAGKAVVRKLNRLRKQLSQAESDFDFYLSRAVREIKSVAALDGEKQKNLVLTLIEDCHCHTWAEIAEDSHLPALKVREIVKELAEAGIVFGRKRHTIGGSANQTLIFSKRKPCSCV